MGNAGSGKSYLASAIAAAWRLPVINLDSIFWMPGGYIEKRPSDDAHGEVLRRQAGEQWIFEGVYGELIALLIDRTEYLIWLDVNWTTCQQSLVARRLLTPERERQKTESSFNALLEYAAAYWSREGPCSQVGHRAIFDQFPRTKQRLQSRKETADFLRTI